MSSILTLLSVSIFYLVGIYDMWTGLRTLVIDAVATYAIAYFIQGPYMPWIGFIFLMGRMSVNHLIRQLDNAPTAIDITGAQMVNIMKLSAFCWNVFDGRYPDSELTESQKERAIRQLPNLLDYAGYVLFFPGLLVGPAFDYVDYQSYITTSMFNLPPGTDPSKAPPTRKKRRIPRSGRYAAWKAATGLAWILVFLQLSNLYFRDYYLTDEFMKYGFFRRIFQLYMLGVTQRTKYYGVWALSEGACILAGIGYRGVDPVTGKPAWDRLTNVQPFKIELAQNVHDYIGYWNINTNHWLRNYVYLRVTPKGKKPGFRASLATFFTSAFWHGFYPGYYLTFMLSSFFQTIAKCKCCKSLLPLLRSKLTSVRKDGRRLLRPLFLEADGKTPTPNKRYYDIFTWFVTQVAFAFAVSPFIILDFASCIKVWGRVYFYAIIGTAACFGFLQSPGRKWLQEQVKKRTGAEKPGLERVKSVERMPTLGMPDDPERAVDEIVQEVKAEIERRRAEGIQLPDVRELIRQKLEEGREGLTGEKERRTRANSLVVNTAAEKVVSDEEKKKNL